MIKRIYTTLDGVFAEIDATAFLKGDYPSTRTSHPTIAGLMNHAQQISEDAISVDSPDDACKGYIHPDIAQQMAEHKFVFSAEGMSCAGRITASPETTEIRLINSVVADGVVFGQGRYVLENVFIGQDTELSGRGDCFLRDVFMGPRNKISFGRMPLGEFVALGANNTVTASNLRDDILLGDHNIISHAAVDPCTIMGSENHIDLKCKIGRRCLLGDSNFLGPRTRINEHSQMGSHNHFCGNNIIGRGTFIENRCMFYPMAYIDPECTIEDFVMCMRYAHVEAQTRLPRGKIVFAYQKDGRRLVGAGAMSPPPEDPAPVLPQISDPLRGDRYSERLAAIRARHQRRAGEIYRPARAPMNPPASPTSGEGHPFDGLVDESCDDNKDEANGSTETGHPQPPMSLLAAVDEDNDEEKNIDRLRNLSAKDIKQQLDEYVIGQEAAKKALAVTGYNYLQGQFGDRVNPAIELPPSHVLLIGSSGCGKTLLTKTLARIINLEFHVFDASQFTESGYKGNNVSKILDALSEHDGEAVVLLDEFDKLYRKVQNWGLSIQNEFLKFLEGGVFDGVDTRKVLFILTGVFQDLPEIVRMRLLNVEKRQLKPQQITDSFFRRHVTHDDLSTYGMSRELLGRIPIIETLEELSRESLMEIFFNCKNSIHQQYQERFAMMSVKLNFTRKGVERLVDQCLQRRVGARGLATEMNKLMTQAIYLASSDQNITEIRVGAHEIERGVVSLRRKPESAIN